MALPQLPAENETHWYTKRNAFDQAVKGELEGRLSEETLGGRFLGDGSNIILSPRPAGARAINIVDDPTSGGDMLRFQHQGLGYAFDISNRPGSGSAFVIHQYSESQAAVQWDNTTSQTMLLMRNTNNPTLNPDGPVSGESATGDYIRAVDATGTPWARLTGRGSWLLTPGTDATTPALHIDTRAGSSQRGILVSQRAPAVGLQVIQEGAAADWFAAGFTGKKYGLSVNVDTTGGNALYVRRTNAEAGGIGVLIRDDSVSGIPLSVQAGSTQVAAVKLTGEIELYSAGIGVVVRSPDGTRYRLVAPNGGGAATWVAA